MYFSKTIDSLTSNFFFFFFFWGGGGGGGSLILNYVTHAKFRPIFAGVTGYNEIGLSTFGLGWTMFDLLHMLEGDIL